MVLLKLFKGDRLVVILILCPASIQACAGSRKARGVGVAGEAHPNNNQRIGGKSNVAAGPSSSMLACEIHGGPPPYGL